MLLWANDFRAVFWVAVIPGLMSVALLAFSLREPASKPVEKRINPIGRENLRRLGASYWGVVCIGAVFTLARFSEAFLVLRAQQSGVPVALVPLVMVAMNLVYALTAYRRRLLSCGDRRAGVPIDESKQQGVTLDRGHNALSRFTAAVRLRPRPSAHR